MGLMMRLQRSMSILRRWRWRCRCRGERQVLVGFFSSGAGAGGGGGGGGVREEAKVKNINMNIREEAKVVVEQVSARNFSGAVVESLRALVGKAAFVAVDAEMTGLCGAPWRDSFEWDSAAVRFLKLRHAASEFALLQFGICPFVLDSSSNNTNVMMLTAHPHTFHLALDTSFLCQTSSLHFLASHRFDFNTSLRHGIPYGDHHLINVIHLLSSPSPSPLLVGHNCILDIAHMYHKFVAPIPSTMPQFIRQVHHSFPHLIDTKHLINAHHSLRLLMANKSKSLSSAFSSLCPTISSPSPSPSPRHLRVHVPPHHHQPASSSFNSAAKHQAGYDAFMTGCVFAQSCLHLGIKFHQPLPPLQSNPNLKPYLNHLYPTWNSGTLLDFATATEKPENDAYRRKYPKVVYENILLLWGFPSTLNSKKLKGCFAQVFGPDSVVSVFSIDFSAALVQFKKQEFLKEFFVLKESLQRIKDDPISALHPLSVIFEGGNTKAGDYNTYRDVIACNLSKVLFKDQADASGVTFTCKVDLENGEADKEEREETVLEEMKRSAGKVLRSS